MPIPEPADQVRRLRALVYNPKIKKMKKIFFLLMILPSVLSAQVETKQSQVAPAQGIVFDQLSWQQVVAKAKADNKYIFVDCYATWCVPCKEMEKKVYPDQKVADFFNARFISVKMQMDTAKNDNEFTRSAYADARYIRKQYRVGLYPTFLFFNPDGRLLDRSAGAMDADNFIKAATDATDPQKNYYSLLKQFQQGNKNMAEMSYLARQGLILGDTGNANKVAATYISSLKRKDLLTKENILFMVNYTQKTKDYGFNFLYTDAAAIDKIMGDDDYAQGTVHGIIYRNKVRPALLSAQKSGRQPDWNSLAAMLRKAYNPYYANRIIAGAKTDWYAATKDTLQYTYYLVRYVDQYVMSIKHSSGNYGLSLVLNNDAWEIFQDSRDSAELTKALSWSGRAVLMYPSPNWMDTYANLLYKLGQVKQAIAWEENAVKLAPGEKQLQEILEKMKSGKATLTKN